MIYPRELKLMTAEQRNYVRKWMNVPGFALDRLVFCRPLRLVLRNLRNLSVFHEVCNRKIYKTHFTWRKMKKREDINTDHLIFHVSCTSEGRHYSNLLTYVNKSPIFTTNWTSCTHLNYPCVIAYVYELILGTLQEVLKFLFLLFFDFMVFSDSLV